MNSRIITTLLKTEEDIVSARQRARQIAIKLGFDRQDQTRIATAVSEIARNAVSYGRGGQVEFRLETVGREQSLVVTVRDKGNGIEDLTQILDGRYQSPTGMGRGIAGTRRLMDNFEIETSSEGTVVVFSKTLPPHRPPVMSGDLASIAAELAMEQASPLEEAREQNRELLQSLQDLSSRSKELEKLAEELESTNRGVVALHGELEATAHELRRASELKTRFLSNMSHEFRTPLNSILALARLLLDRTDGELSEEQEKQVKFIVDAASGLSDMVNDLLDIAKVEAGKIDVRPQRFDVFELFGALRGLLKPLKTNSKVDLVFDEPSGVPVMYTDERKVTQILRNFISNALKYTETGTVLVRAEFKEPDRVLFSVTDTGIGIPTDAHDRIFEEFEQIPNALQAKVKGTGLGLPLSKRLAELLHGKVAVDSEPGKGSTFYLDVPARWTSEGAGPVLPGPERMSDKPRVLVADDEEAFRYVMRRLINPQNYEILEAADGETALATILSAEPDLVILDINMPRRDGYGVLEEVVKHSHAATIPVIVSSSLALSEADRTRLSHAFAVVSKANLSVELIGALLADALGRRR